MSRNAVPIAVVICVLILAVAGVLIVFKVRSDSTSSSPIATSSSSIPATSSAPASSAPATTAPATSPAASGSAPLSDFTVCITPVDTCGGEMRAEPSQIIVSGDGSAFIGGLTWTGWGQSGATGAGTLKLDNCDPNCAQGKFTPYAATVTLSDLTSYGTAGEQGYADMTVSSPGSPYGTKSYSNLLP